jgi:hypothetical protein
MSELRFLQVDLQMLSEFGLAPRLLMLYGRLRLHQGKNGKCYPKHSTLAKEVGLKSTRHVRRLLDQLRLLRLIESARTGGPNDYKVLEPDRTFLSYRMGHKSPLSDRTRMSYRKDPANEKKQRKEAVSQPAYGKGETGGLAELLTRTWAHIPGAPGPKLLARIAAILGDIPVEQFQALLVSRRMKARSFGLAEQLAVELRQRWNADAAERKRIAEAEAQDKIQRIESWLADPSTPPEERPDLERYLSELRAMNGAARTDRAAQAADPNHTGRNENDTQR